MTTDEQPSSSQLAQDRTDLAALRNLMAADRTLMAWVRTSLSVLVFGFTVYKILHELQKVGVGLPREHTPRNAGLFLSAMGTLAIVMGIIEYRHTLKLLRQLQHFSFARPTLIMAALMLATGVVLLVGIIASLF